MNRVKIFFVLVSTFALASCGSGDKSNSNASAPADTAAKTAASAQVQTILFFGDSLTAGYGLDDPANAFPGVIAKKIDSLKLPYKVINAGVSGETSAGGNGRIDWTLKQKVDIFILELGANDGLRGISPTETTKNLQSIIDKVKAKYPAAKLVMLGMQVPPNMGADYVNKFKAVFPALATKNKMALVPFLLQGVGGHPDLNQGDGIHPTEKGAKIVAGNVWEVLKGELDNPKGTY
ncbi:arylesterase [Mucilaginibacter ginsenosidivorax]|uniref:Arylesterase n=1 Tax=Mucilaginibacter ginsenosidivorax TaxID=862126 RepID=A0A5B8W881_9SPHI|nr:arylesterase [Mucilaginibacter ginsenosidivorax]QEC79166.1 arylesterase [Mucilaginibacter ginsenosidivorax]